jgi:DNA-binding response OmpR family regulator
MLPGIDGFEIMRKIEPLHIPVIFLTAKDSLTDKVTGLKLGADDYIVKPFETLELISRIEAVLRRSRPPISSHIELDDLIIKLDEHMVLKNGRSVELTAKEFALLDVLIRNINIALSRERLLELVWGYDYLGETRTVDVHIMGLRKKLGLTDRIKTISKLGYRLEDAT